MEFSTTACHKESRQLAPPALAKKKLYEKKIYFQNIKGFPSGMESVVILFAAASDVY